MIQGLTDAVVTISDSTLMIVGLGHGAKRSDSIVGRGKSNNYANFNKFLFFYMGDGIGRGFELNESAEIPYSAVLIADFARLWFIFVFIYGAFVYG